MNNTVTFTDQHGHTLHTENGHTATIANYDPLPLPAGDRPMTIIYLPRTNPDMLIGTTPPDDLRGIDIAASVDTFDDLLTAYISEHYPDAIVEYGASNWFVDDDDRDTARSIMLDITDAADRIFSDGMFWVTEETGQ